MMLFCSLMNVRLFLRQENMEDTMLTCYSQKLKGVCVCVCVCVYVCVCVCVGGGACAHLHIKEISCRHDGLIIMATNRPFDLDEAMHRRITIALEFRQPDHLLRKAIWESHIPAEMKMDKEVNLVSFKNENASVIIFCFVTE